MTCDQLAKLVKDIITNKKEEETNTGMEGGVQEDNDNGEGDKVGDNDDNENGMQEEV
jgi:hypothetical protein